jgi:Ice-binding-like
MYNLSTQARAATDAHARPTPTRHLAWFAVLLTALVTAFAVSAAPASAAQPAVSLGTANAFALMAGSAITNTGPSTINGDLGLSPGTAVSGFPPATLNGTAHVTDAVASIAQNDLTTAYNDAAGRGPATAVPADLGGLTVTSGVYENATALGLTGSLTLDAQGNPNAVFIFKAGSSLTTASASSVNMVNGAQACNVFWKVGSSATLGTTSTMIGSIMALTSVSLNNAVTVNGRVLARNGAVTLINDTISRVPCAAGTIGGPGGPPIAGAGNGSGSGSGNGSGSSSGIGTAVLATGPRSVGRLINTFGTTRCVDRSFRVSVTGTKIKKVVFTLGGKTLVTRTKSPFIATVPVLEGDTHVVHAHVTFTDKTKPANLKLHFKACAEATAQTPRIPTVGFTG